MDSVQLEYLRLSSQISAELVVICLKLLLLCVLNRPGWHDRHDPSGQGARKVKVCERKGQRGPEEGPRRAVGTTRERLAEAGQRMLPVREATRSPGPSQAQRRRASLVWGQAHEPRVPGEEASDWEHRVPRWHGQMREHVPSGCVSWLGTLIPVWSLAFLFLSNRQTNAQVSKNRDECSSGEIAHVSYLGQNITLVDAQEILGLLLCFRRLTIWFNFYLLDLRYVLFQVICVFSGHWFAVGVANKKIQGLSLLCDLRMDRSFSSNQGPKRGTKKLRRPR